MIGYIGIGFLTLGKAVIPMLPEAFYIFGTTLDVTLMRAIVVIAVITGVYITFGGQTAVIFTDLLQGFILIFAGFIIRYWYRLCREVVRYFGTFYLLHGSYPSRIIMSPPVLILSEYSGKML